MWSWRLLQRVTAEQDERLVAKGWGVLGVMRRNRGAEGPGPRGLTPNVEQPRDGDVESTNRYHFQL